MDLVIDANILFSVLIKKGKTEEIIFEEDLHLFAPEFIFEEFSKYEGLIRDKTERNKGEFERLMDILKKKIKTTSNEETQPYIKKAKEMSPDKNDADYIALALKLRCPLWSNDKELKKQKEVLVYSTEDLVKIFNF